MDMSGEQRIPAPRDVVWEALNDPEVLRASISGCEELQRTDDGGFSAKVRAKVGPVSAKFSGKVKIIDADPPNGYRIEGEGTGGAAGFAKGGADVLLAEEGPETVLTYTANASVGGKLAQIGSRLIDGTARKMADEFFAKFSEIAAERAAGETGTEARVEYPRDHATPTTDGVAEALAEDPHSATDHPAGKATETSSHAAHDVAEVADLIQAASKGVPQWLWVAGFAVVVVGLLIFFI